MWSLHVPLVLGLYAAPIDSVMLLNECDKLRSGDYLGL